MFFWLLLYKFNSYRVYIYWLLLDKFNSYRVYIYELKISIFLKFISKMYDLELMAFEIIIYLSDMFTKRVIHPVDTLMEATWLYVYLLGHKIRFKKWSRHDIINSYLNIRHLNRNSSYSVLRSVYRTVDTNFYIKRFNLYIYVKTVKYLYYSSTEDYAKIFHRNNIIYVLLTHISEIDKWGNNKFRKRYSNKFKEKFGKKKFNVDFLNEFSIDRGPANVYTRFNHSLPSFSIYVVGVHYTTRHTIPNTFLYTAPYTWTPESVLLHFHHKSITKKIIKRDANIYKYVYGNKLPNKGKVEARFLLEYYEKTRIEENKLKLDRYATIQHYCEKLSKKMNKVLRSSLKEKSNGKIYDIIGITGIRWRSFSFSSYYIQGFVFLLFVDACLTDDEPLWEPIEWSLVQTWVLFIFIFGWIAENLIVSRYGSYSGRDKRVWMGWYKTFWLLEVFYLVSFLSAAVFIIVPFYFETNYSLSFIYTWWHWYSRVFFFKFISLFSIVIVLAYLLQLSSRWLNWRIILLTIILINIFLSYLLYTHFIMSFFGYFTNPIWYKNTRPIDYIQLSHEPSKWGWGSAMRDHYGPHNTKTVFWFKNDGPFASAFLLFHLYIFLSLFFVYVYWIALFRRVFSTKEVPITYTTYCVSSLKQLLYLFLCLYFFIALSFVIQYWRLPIELFFGTDDRSWFSNLILIFFDYPKFIINIIH